MDDKNNYEKVFKEENYFPRLGGDFYLGAMGFRYLLKINELEKKVNQYGRK